MGMLETTIKNLRPGAHVLDFGSLGWSLYQTTKTNRPDLKHHACDVHEPVHIPSDITFYKIEQRARRIPCEDDLFDLIVASHVFEHVHDPVELFQELGRICRPGGIIYIESPSDRSCLVKSDRFVESHSFFSFWDDPTHLRPWSPAALYRLGISYGFIPLKVSYLGSFLDRVLFPLHWLKACLTGNRHALTEAVWKANKWACAALLQKPENMNGTPVYVFISLKNVPVGSGNALEHRNSQL